MDGGSAQRRVVAVVAGRLVVGRAVKGGTESVDGVALEAEPDVGVNGGGDADVGVAEEFLDDDEFDALFQEEGGGRVAEVVEADAPEPGPVEEAAGEVGRVERPSGRRGEYEAAVAPVRSCCLSLLALPSAVLLEGVDAFGGEGDTSLGRPGLGGQMREAAGAGALE